MSIKYQFGLIIVGLLFASFLLEIRNTDLKMQELESRVIGVK